jgi:hypothetical protein
MGVARPLASELFTFPASFVDSDTRHWDRGGCSIHLHLHPLLWLSDKSPSPRGEHKGT